MSSIAKTFALQPPAGPTLLISAAFGVTLKPVPLTISVPVIMITLLPPTGAVGKTAMVAVAVFGLVIVKFETLTPAPSMASVVPWTQFVEGLLEPVIVTSTLAPCCALDTHGFEPVTQTLTRLGSAGESIRKPVINCSSPVLT